MPDNDTVGDLNIRAASWIRGNDHKLVESLRGLR